MDYATRAVTWTSSGGLRATDVYRNTGAPTAAYSANPGTYLGDDLVMTGGGVLSTIEFSVYASGSNARTFDQSDFTIDIYNDTDGTYVGTVDFGTVNWGSLPAGFYTTFAVTGLEAQNILLPQSIDVIQHHANVVGGPKVGQVLADPPSLGSSGDYFYIDDTAATPPGTTQGWSYFGGNPKANFYWAVGVVPEPAALALLALGSLLLRRR